MNQNLIGLLNFISSAPWTLALTNRFDGIEVLIFREVRIFLKDLRANFLLTIGLLRHLRV